MSTLITTLIESIDKVWEKSSHTKPQKLLLSNHDNSDFYIVISETTNSFKILNRDEIILGVPKSIFKDEIISKDFDENINDVVIYEYRILTERDSFVIDSLYPLVFPNDKK